MITILNEYLKMENKFFLYVSLTRENSGTTNFLWKQYNEREIRVTTTLNLLIIPWLLNNLSVYCTFVYMYSDTWINVYPVCIIRLILSDIYNFPNGLISVKGISYKYVFHF